MRYLTTHNVGRSQFGNNEPQIEIAWDARTSHRQIMSHLHTLAAKAEAESEGEDWLIHLERLDEKGGKPRGRVWVELITSDNAEMIRAVAMLNRVD